MKRPYLLIAILAAATNAQAQDPHSIAPPEILNMDSLPNAGELFIRYCVSGFFGGQSCVERSTSCHGQCCSQGEADDIGYGCSGDVYGDIPSGAHYAGWTCKMYSTPVSTFPLEGKPGPEPSYIKECRNPR
jgi:hypothetical protein